MKTTALKIFVSDSLGEVSAEIIEPEKPKVIMTLAHGAGAGMAHPFMKNLSMDLAQYSVVTLRFNLHYMEQKKKRPDPPPIAHKVIRAAIEKAHALYPSLPVVVSGKSFGGRMTSQLLASDPIPFVKGVVFYGFPLHAAGSPGVERSEHLAGVKVPMLFLQGSRDALAQLSLISTVTESLPDTTLEVIENADHSFKVGKKDSIDHLSKKTESWLRARNILNA